MAFLYKYNWSLLIGAEALTWIFLFLFIIVRYKYGFVRLSQLLFSIVIFCTVFQGMLAGISYYYSEEVSFYQIFIVLLIIYGSTIGHKDFKRLDLYLQQKIQMKRSSYDGDIYTYFKKRSCYFVLHSAVYLSFYLLYIGENQLISILFFLWSIVYIFEAVMIVIYTIWLWKNKTSSC